ncbi:MAG: phenylacetate--CoA ligase family protein [Betaproteobacteria bacterium]|nr:phenylacetate--CoA ligase family protein [Betaproteobacteria bacterium]
MKYFDDLETRSAETRERAQFSALQDQIGNAKKNAPYFTRLLSGVQPYEVKDRLALAKLPVTRKSDLIALQRKELPFAGMTAMDVRRLGRVFASPGPIYDPQGDKKDYWGIGRALFAAGFREGDLVHNTFSYHFTPAGFMYDLGAQSIGCPVFPAGVGQTELQVQTISDLKPVAYAGTPSFLKILLEKADELELDISHMQKAAVGGEAFLPPQKKLFAERGIVAYQSYGTADLGLIAYETPAREGLVVDEGVIVEIVRPGTGDPVPDGEVGEVVVSTFTPSYPLIRFATGDMSAVLAGTSPCGRTNMRIKGWMGRADQTTKVRGMFVHPSQVAEVLKRHKEVLRARLVVTHDAERNDQMTLRCEVSDMPEGLSQALSESVRDLCKVRGSVEVMAPGTLPNDGKVIDDQRRYD